MLENMSFEELIIWCCKTSEEQLRDEIKILLLNNNFLLLEDEYVTARNLNERKEFHNLLFIRGNPKYCLVAHTDVCRDHEFFHKNNIRSLPIPTVKDKDGKKIIQDLNCEVQVGGDDRLGVAITLWIATHHDIDIGILFTTDEEIGLLSAEKVSFKELNNFELLIQIDRGNRSNQIVNSIGGIKLCDDNIVQKFVNISKELKMEREVVFGYYTDVLAIKKNGFCKNAVNLTCGYHDSYGNSGSEYIDIEEAENTAKLINCFIQTEI